MTTKASNLVDDRKSFRLRMTSGVEFWDVAGASSSRSFFERTTSRRSLSCNSCESRTPFNKLYSHFKRPTGASRTPWLLSPFFARCEIANNAVFTAVEWSERVNQSAAIIPLVHTCGNYHGRLHDIQAYGTFCIVNICEVVEDPFCEGTIPIADWSTILPGKLFNHSVNIHHLILRWRRMLALRRQH